jgi:hypothetical protein
MIWSLRTSSRCCFQPICLSLCVYQFTGPSGRHAAGALRPGLDTDTLYHFRQVVNHPPFGGVQWNGFPRAELSRVRRWRVRGRLAFSTYLAGTATDGGALSAQVCGLSARGTRPWPSSGTGATPQPCRSRALVAKKLQASCKPVAGWLEPSSSSLPPGPNAEQSCGPVGERRSVALGPSIGYRLRKGCQGYRDLTDFNLACATHSDLAPSRDDGTDEIRPCFLPCR